MIFFPIIYFLSLLDTVVGYTCDVSCKTCSGSSNTKCLTCNVAWNRVDQSTSTHSCPCKSGFYNTGINTCPPCLYNCLTCSGSASNCILCAGSGNGARQSAPTCSCQSTQYYDDGSSGSCQSEINQQISGCNHYCVGCSSSASYCNQCVASGTGPQSRSSTPTCSCQPGYYDDGSSAQCQICNYKCATCSGSAITCQTCAGSGNGARIIAPFCFCQPAYYDDGSSAQCLGCSNLCSTCSGPASTQCTSCDTLINRVFSPSSQSCPCNTSYYSTGSVSCTSCHYSCLDCTGSSSNQCTSCPNATATSRLPLDNNGYCLCSGGRYDDGTHQLCQYCHYSCNTCNVGGITGCLDCGITSRQRTLLTDKSCTCNTNYIDTGIADCNPSECDPTCSTCNPPTSPSTISQQCLTCHSGSKRVLTSSTCPCPDSPDQHSRAYYSAQGLTNCDECSFQCSSCTSGAICQACQSTRYQPQLNCTCQPGYFEPTSSSFLCGLCHPQCLTCSAADVCITCSTYRNNILPACPCAVGQYDDTINAQCPQCDLKCSACSGSSTNCQSCVSSTRDSTSHCNCNVGYYEINQIDCLKCDFRCTTCLSTSTNCQTCSGNRNSDQPTCSCPSNYFDNNINAICPKCAYQCLTCLTTSTNCQSCAANRNPDIPNCTCPNQFYDDGNNAQCQPCDFRCNTCLSTGCLFCSGNRNSDQPVCSCPSDYFDDNTNAICPSCAYQCLTCDTNSTNCLSCKGLYRSAIIPLCLCIAGYYDDGINFNCLCIDSIISSLECDYSCLTCDNTAKNCTSCDASRSLPGCTCPDGGFDKVNLAICQNCAYQCSTCVSAANNCKFCASNRNQDYPYCTCPLGYYDDGFNPTCAICNYKCLSCVKFPTNCLNCAFNRVTLPVCLCPVGTYESSNTTLACQSCSARCVSCIQSQDQCLKCRPYRQQAPSCLCRNGYYETQSIVCEKCSYQCKTCVTSADNCLTCVKPRVISSQCQCPQRYYETLSLKCAKCHYSCLTCSENFQSSCLSCNINSHRILEGDQCLCQNYFSDLNKVELCQACHYSCSQCNGVHQNNCTQCNLGVSHRKLSIQGTCDCIQFKYYDVNGTHQCDVCSNQIVVCQNPVCGDGLLMIHEECDDGNLISRDGCSQTCKVEPNYRCTHVMLQLSICTTCEANCNICDSDLQCTQCMDGYFKSESTSTCQQCAPRCKVCLSPFISSCQECLDPYHLNGDGRQKKCITCEVEPGLHTSNGVCVSICGDGIQRSDFGEKCDDGNSLNDDGCSDKCLIEDGYECQTKDHQLSRCFLLIRVKAFIVFTNKYNLYQPIRLFTLSFESPLNLKKKINLVTQINVNFSTPLDYSVDLLKQIYNPKGQLLQIQYQLTLNQTIKNGTLVVNFLDSGDMVDDKNHTVVSFTNSTMPGYQMVSTQVKEVSQGSVKLGQVMLYTIASIAVISALTGGLEIFWNILDLIQLFSYLEFLNVQYPYNMDLFLMAFSFVKAPVLTQSINVQFFNDIVNYLVPLELQVTHKFKINDAGIGPIFLFNLLSISGSFFITLGMYLFCKYTLPCLTLNINPIQYEKISKCRQMFIRTKIRLTLFLQILFKSYVNNYFYSILIRTFISSSYDLDFALIMQIEQYRICAGYPYLFISVLSSILITLLMGYLIYYGFKQASLSKRKLMQVQTQQKIGSLFDGVELKNNDGRSYNSLLLIKRFFFMVCLVLFYDFPFIQILSITSVLIGFTVYILVVNPFEEQIEYYKSVCCDTIMALFVLISVLFALNDEFKTNNQTELLFLGWIEIGLFLFALFLQIMIDSYQQYKVIARKFKSLIKKVEKFFGIYRDLQPIPDKDGPTKGELIVINTNMNKFDQ